MTSSSTVRVLLACIVLTTALLASGCRIMYVPNAHNVPMFREKGEIHANVGTRNFQAAYAPAEKVGVIANAQIGSNSWNDVLTTGGAAFDWTTNRSLFEIGAGTWQPLDNNISFETYGGVGFGNVRFDRSFSGIPDARYNANMMRFFLQPSFSVTSQHFDAGFSMRLAGLNFLNVDTTGYTYDDLVAVDLNDLDQDMHMFIEPAVTLRAGYQYVKFHTQLGYAIKLNDAPLSHNPFILNIGLRFHFAQRWADGNAAR